MRTLRIQFAPLPLLECQKLWWLWKNRAFTVVEEQPDIVFHWDYINTHFQGLHHDYGCKEVNIKCLDVSKTRINELCKEIYGYGSEALNGWAVEKNDLMNGIKDIRLVHLEENERREGYFYQKLLFFPKQDKVFEIRLVVMNGRPVYKFMKQKQVNLGNICGKVKAYSIMPYHEDTRIDTFCQKIGLDYGELDMMNFDGLDYIIDVNPTPGDTAFVNMQEDVALEFCYDYLRLFKENYHA